ncbi:MAG: amino acid-binding protein [Kiritimatiellae bacterium]|nr:amino acid-binding protein [Kiritimatiellia bacterium]
MSSKNVKVTAGKQISVFLENQPGTLAELTEFLGKKGINIFALTLTGGIDHGYGRVVVDKHAEAVEALRESGHLVFERDVILLEISNTPGSLGAVLRKWADAGVNLDYAYCAGGPGVEQGLVVVRVDDTGRALSVLRAE